MQPVIRLGAMTVTFLKTRHESKGLLDAFEITLPPDTGGVVPHIHHASDETVLGIDGITLWTVGGRQIQMGPGQKIDIPRGVPHGFINLHNSGARFLCILTPGALGPEYFDELASTMKESGPTNFAALGAIMTRYGVIPAKL
jgi:quercetin dioxygenase-like cupin family protein